MGIVHGPMDDIDAHFVGNTSGNVNSSDNSSDGPNVGAPFEVSKNISKVQNHYASFCFFLVHPLTFSWL
jgi:hypothetical protein